MMHEVHCSCGWQDSLTEFYGGKLVRCPMCDLIIEVPRTGTVYSLEISADAQDAQDAPPAYAYPPLPDWSAGQNAGVTPGILAPPPAPPRMPLPRPVVPFPAPKQCGGVTAFWLGFSSLLLAALAAGAGGPVLLFALMVTVVALSVGLLTLRDGNGSGRAVVGLLFASLGLFVTVMGFGAMDGRHSCRQWRNHHVMVMPAPETEPVQQAEPPMQGFRYPERTPPAANPEPAKSASQRSDPKTQPSPRPNGAKARDAQETRY